MNSGLVVSAVDPKDLFAQIGIPRGTLILSINGGQINSVGDMIAALNSASNGIARFECLSPEGSRIVFNLSMGHNTNAMLNKIQHQEMAACDLK
ncbi:hypothetical protein SAMN05421827_11880 [Pedobacter terrae]|uniref:PDZ domain-containing protein n=1 Tax=Pedobacter terrae TaxID=405671 RepID=A0A1G8ACA0_9SPHI|nr:hypothetical protein SAMN05421827_11880 [Pedobacter terrae]